MQINKRIKQFFCKHKNKQEAWEYRNDFRYNEFFKDAIITRERVLVCKDCGKRIDSLHVELVAFDQLKEELRKEVI